MVGIKTTVEELAKAAVLADAQDLPGLVALQEKFDELVRNIGEDTDLAPLLDVGESAKTLIDEIVMRTTPNADAAIDLIRQCVETAQHLLEEVGDTQDSTPFNDLDFDLDLLEAWVSCCRDQLTTLEETIVAIESAEAPDELIDEARRVIHTIKGEAGVLSLGVAQRLFHEAETLIDACSEAQSPYPVGTTLALIDWLRSYTDALAADPNAGAPDPSEIEALLAGSQTPRPAAPARAVESAPVAAPPASAPQDDGPVTFPDDLGMDENLTDFLCEAREHIGSAEEALLALEDDPTDNELVNTVFRGFHTIKGVAGFMHMVPIVDLAHNAETLLDKARNGELTLDSAYLDLILQSCDMLTSLIAMLEGETAPLKSQHTRLLNQLKAAVDGEGPHSVPPAGLQPAGSAIQDFHPLGMILVELGLCTDDSVEAALTRQREGSLALRQILLEAGMVETANVEQELTTGSELGTAIADRLVDLDFVSRRNLDEAVAQAEASSKRLGELLGLTGGEIAGALHVQRKKRRDDGAMPPPGAQAPPQAEAAPAAPTATRTRNRADQTVKVSTSRMDVLVTMVGELVIAQQMVVQDPAVQSVNEQRFQKNMAQVGKIIRDLQSVSMSLRMVTVKGTFQKMARIIRDVSAKAGKRIQFVMEGEDTELDRNVVEEIGDPLVHMIRNACDHGIEPADERIAAGKSESGTLTLRAYHQGGSIVIEVADDGRGLPREKILNKAMERGIVTEREVAEMADHEIYNLIFQPGFSTAEKVTDISGRGVGMDVVRKNIEALRGKVEILSTPGEGSIFRMRLPLTMAIIDGMVVRVGSQRYVVPTLAIEQSFQPTASDLHTSLRDGEMASVRGSLLPIYRLNRVLDTCEGIDTLTDALLLVLESNNARCCLAVDEILGQQQVVIKNLGRGVPHHGGVSGGAILGDGRVALILDIAGIVKQAISSSARAEPRRLAA